MPKSITVLNYDYLDEQSNVVHRAVRTEYADGSKKIRQRRPDGNGGWIDDLKGVTPVPYHLPEVLEVIRRNGIVFVAEGEKKCDVLNAALKAKGFVAIATCNNGGAEHWGEAQSKWLNGARVCLLPDNDAAGFRHVEMVARSLMGIATSIKRTDLPGLEDKGDIDDWLQDHTVNDLRPLYHAAEEYTPPPVVEKPKRVATKPVTRKIDNDTYLQKWARHSLETAASNLAILRTGRFKGMKARANFLGTIAAQGLLNEQECVDHLLYACDKNGYIAKKGNNPQTIEREIRHYFNSGLPFPCDLPDPKETDRPALKIELPATQVWKSVPIAVRGSITANVYPSTAPIVEVIFEGIDHGLVPLNGKRVSVKKLFAVSEKLGRGLSMDTIRKGLVRGANPLGVQFLRVFLPIYKQEDESPSGDVESMGGKSARNTTPGRKEEEYELLSIQEILDNLVSFVMAPLIKQAFPIKSNLAAPIMAEFLKDLNRDDAESSAKAIMDEYGALIEAQPGYKKAWNRVRTEYRKILGMFQNPEFAPLPPGSYRNTSEYMTMCARAVMTLRGGATQIPLSEWAIYLGCTSRNVNTVLKRAGIEVVNEQYSERVVTHIGQIKSLKIGFDTVMEGYPRTVGSNLSGSYVKVNSQRLVEWCEKELAKGAQLTVRYSMSNKQFYPPREPEEAAKDAPKTRRKGTSSSKGPTEPKERRETWREANERKLVALVAKSKKIPIEMDGKIIVNKQTGEHQLSLDFLLNRTTEPEKIDEQRALQDAQALELQQQAKDTADIVAWMVSDLGGTVSAVHDRGTPEYQLHAGT